MAVSECYLIDHNDYIAMIGPFEFRSEAFDFIDFLESSEIGFDEKDYREAFRYYRKNKNKNREERDSTAFAIESLNEIK